MPTPNERIDVLETYIRSMNETMNKNVNRTNTWFDKIDARLAVIETSLSSIQETLHWLGQLIYKKFGDHPDANHEQMGE